MSIKSPPAAIATRSNLALPARPFAKTLWRAAGPFALIALAIVITVFSTRLYLAGTISDGAAIMFIFMGWVHAAMFIALGRK